MEHVIQHASNVNACFQLNPIIKKCMESMTTTDNGELDVHIAPIGEFKGSNSLGNPVPEKITKESLENLAEKLNKGDEILADIDH